MGARRDEVEERGTEEGGAGKAQEETDTDQNQKHTRRHLS